MNNLKMPVAVITFLAAQAGGMVWFLSGMEGRVKTLEGKRLTDIELIGKEKADAKLKDHDIKLLENKNLLN